MLILCVLVAIRFGGITRTSATGRRRLQLHLHFLIDLFCILLVGILVHQRLPYSFSYVSEPVGHLQHRQSRLIAQIFFLLLLQIWVFHMREKPFLQRVDILFIESLLARLGWVTWSLLFFVTRVLSLFVAICSNILFVSPT